MEDGGSSVPPFSVGQCYSPHLPYAIRIAGPGPTADNGGPRLRQRSTRDRSRESSCGADACASRPTELRPFAQEYGILAVAILLLCARESIAPTAARFGRLAR